MCCALADQVNHYYKSSIDWKCFNKRLHVPAQLGAENKVYLYEHDWDKEEEELEEVESQPKKSMWNYNLSRLY